MNQSQISVRKFNVDSKKEEIEQIIGLIQNNNFCKFEVIVIFKQVSSSQQPEQKKNIFDVPNLTDLEKISELQNGMNQARVRSDFTLSKSLCRNLIDSLNIQIQKQNYNFLKMCLQNKQIAEASKLLEEQKKSFYYELISNIEVIFNKNTQKQKHYITKLVESYKFIDFLTESKQFITFSKLSKLFQYCFEQSNEIWEKIHSILKRTIVKDEMFFQKIYLEAEIETRRGQYKKAIQLLQSIQEQKLQNHQKYQCSYLIGLNLILLKDYKIAFEVFKILHLNIGIEKSKMRKLLTKYYYGFCLEKFNKLDEAEKIIRELFSLSYYFLDSSNIILLEASQLFAQILFKQKKYQESKIIYLAVVDLQQRFPDIQRLAFGKTYNNLATVYTELNDHHGASTYYEMALKIFKQENCKLQYIQRVEKNLRYNQKKRQQKSKQ